MVILASRVSYLSSYIGFYDQDRYLTLNPILGQFQQISDRVFSFYLSPVHWLD